MKNYSIDFFRDEVKSGFFIPTALKQAWAAQLMVLNTIDSICQKHNITYFADWGTLLGTVRHGGYVPWDDDLDICMKREDYTRFKEVAKTELPKHFCIHDYAQKDNHWLFLSRVVNHSHICYEPEHLERFHNFPYLASIDIFVLDYLYADPAEEANRCEEIKHILSIADAIVEGKLSENVKTNALSALEEKYAIQIDKHLNNTKLGIELYRLAEQQMARVPENESNKLGQIFPFILLGHDGLTKKNYENIVRLPFENTTMPVPANYHKLLSNKYGEYFKVKKVWDGHEYPFFEGQRANLQAIADFKLPEFTFHPDMLRQNNPYDTHRKTMKNIVNSCIAELENLFENYSNLMDTKQIPDAIELLPTCQGIAIELGTYIESALGENDPIPKQIIPTLETYCENLFQLYSLLTEPAETSTQDCAAAQDEMKQSLREAKSIIERMILNRKTVVLLPDNPNRWHEMAALYDFYLNQPDTDTYVVPLPIFAKDPYGQIQATEDELHLNARENEYPANLHILSWNTIDIPSCDFDVMIIQNPYDGENPYLTVPEAYYARTLQKYTKCLIYLMPSGIKDFSKQDKTDFYGLKNYLTMPGAMYADKILIHSPEMLALYVDFLTDFAGEDTREVWEEKLCTTFNFTGKDLCASNRSFKDSNTLSTILYCIGQNDFAENIDIALKKLQERIDTFKKYKNKIKVVVCTYPYSLTDWDVCTYEIKQKIGDILHQNQDNNWFKLCDSVNLNFANINAYYGSPSPLVHIFTELHKPVMISQNTDL